MQLEQQVISRELAKKLKELGVKQESLFWYDWVRPDVGEEGVFALTQTTYTPDAVSAFTVAELGELLPKAHLTTQFHDGWYAYDGDGEYVADAKTEADARAKMLIHLIENGLMEGEIEKAKAEG